MNVVAIIQARMGSTRLPGKVLVELLDRPLLLQVVARVSRAASISSIVIATTTRPGDDAIATLCAQNGIACFRGSENDVLDRYYRTASEHKADVVVRITSDCPLIEPEVLDQVVHAFLAHQPECDYASNTLPPRTYPRGLDTEVMHFAALARAWQEDQDPAWREHVTPYLYRHPEEFKLLAVANDIDYSALRWTVDTPEDLALVWKIYGYFGHNRFSWREALALVEQHPEWSSLNQHIEQKVV